MLTKDLSIVRYEDRNVFPDRLVKNKHQHYILYAQRMIDIYKNGLGKMRKELHAQVRNLFESEYDCPPKRIDAFCKLLDEAGTFDLAKGKKAPDLRIKLFRIASQFHPLVRTKDRLFEHPEDEVKKHIADEFKKKWEDIESEMFADVIDFHRLKSFNGFEDPGDLLSRYNIAQIQAALFPAVRLRIRIGEDFKTVLTYAKLARLMHTIEFIGNGNYRVILDGPASVLRNTKRYGVNMAKFIPALVACTDWDLDADIATRRKGFMRRLRLSSKEKLRSHLPSPKEFDSSYESSFAEKWGDERREGWKLIREGGVLHRGQKVFVPDFLLEHEDGRKVYLEIVGFWTPQYLKAKIEVLQLFKEHPILVAIAETSARQLNSLPGNVIRFKTSLSLKDALTSLSSLSENL